MGEDLSRGVEDIVAVWADAMNVVYHQGKLASLVRTRLLFHKLFESIFDQLFILDVVSLMLF